jgi:uncharacterized membrane protein
MSKYFFTGLILLLPVTLTLLLVVFIINVLTNPFAEPVSVIFSHYDIFNKPFLFLSGPQVLKVVTKLVILLSLFVLTLLAGFVGRLLFFNAIFRFADLILHKIPMVNRIYKTAQDIVKTIFTSEKPSFSTAVLVPFPSAKSYNVGFITSDSMPEDSDAVHRELVSVFVPGTPNPTMGFVLLFKKEQLIPLNMTVEEALKFIISCGVMCPDFKSLPQKTPYQDIAGK